MTPGDIIENALKMDRIIRVSKLREQDLHKKLVSAHNQKIPPDLVPYRKRQAETDIILIQPRCNIGSPLDFSSKTQTWRYDLGKEHANAALAMAIESSKS